MNKYSALRSWVISQEGYCWSRNQLHVWCLLKAINENPRSLFDKCYFSYWLSTQLNHLNLSQMCKPKEITSDAFSDYKRNLALHLNSHMNFLMKNLPPTSEEARTVGFIKPFMPMFYSVSPCSEPCLAQSRHTVADLSQGLKWVQGLTFKSISSCWGLSES